MACNVTSLAAVKEAGRGSMGREGLYLIRSLTRDLRELCRQLGRGVGCPHSLGVARFTSRSLSDVEGQLCTTSFTPLRGWDYIAVGPSRIDLDKMAGKSISSLPPGHIDLLEQLSLKKSRGGKEMMSFVVWVGKVERAVTRVTHLHRRAAHGESGTPMYQVCALVQDLFSRTLPLPTSSAAKSGRGTGWLEGELTLISQR